MLNTVNISKSISVLLLLLFITSNVFAQEERKHVREGNDAYKKGDYEEAEVQYLKALENNNKLYEGTFNLGDALYKQERYDEAVNQFQMAASKTTDKKQQAKAYHNLGNTYMKQKKLKEGIEAYKNALRANPKDMDTKYNLSKAMRMLQQQQQQQKQDQDKKDDKKEGDKDKQDQDKKDGDKNEQEKDKEGKDKKDGDKDGEQDKKEKKDQEKDGEHDKNGKPNEQEEKKPQPQQAKMSKEEAQRMLEALKNEERKVQEKMMLQKKQERGKKTDIEKDW